MKAKLLLIILLSIVGLSTNAQTHQWSNGMGGTLDDEIFDITHDASGNIYVTGIFEGTADLDPGVATLNFTSFGAGDMFFAKYDANGNLIWVKAVGSIGDEEGQGIKLDASGNIYVTGLFSDVADFDPGIGTVNLTSNGGFDVYIAKYDNNGNYIWAKNFGDVSNGDDYPSKMILDASGSVYVTGQFMGTCDFDAGVGTANLISSGGWDIFFTKYDGNGNYVWAKSIDNTTNADDFGYNITLDASNNVYVTGQYDGTCDFDPGTGTANLTSVGSWDMFFAKYDNSGNYIWAKSIGGAGDDAGNSILLDAGGNIYVAGYFTGTSDFDAGTGTANLMSAGAEDIFFMKYDNSGNYVWAKNIGGTSTDLANCIAFDALGSILLTGQFSGSADFDPGTGSASSTSAGSWDIFFAKYHADGSYYWSVTIGGIGVDQSHVIDFVSGGYFLIAGEVPNTVDFDPGTGTAGYTSAGLDDAMFAKYYDATTGVAEINNETVINVFPNPFSVGTTLHVGNILRDATLTVYNTQGQTVKQINNLEGQTIHFYCDNLPGGLYFLRLTQDSKVIATNELVITD